MPSGRLSPVLRRNRRNTMEFRPTYNIKINGSDVDKDGMPLAIETEDQCRGVLAFMIDDDSMRCRMYGESNRGDLARVLYLIKKEFGADVYDLADRVADILMEAEENVGSGEAETDPGSDELCGMPEGGEGLLGGVRGHGDTQDNDCAGAAGDQEADAAVL